jgi:hypothetical protein
VNRPLSGTNYNWAKRFAEEMLGENRRRLLQLPSSNCFMLLTQPVLFVSWRNPKSRRIYPVGRLTCDLATHLYEFDYIRFVERAVRDGFTPFPEFPRLCAVYRSQQLFPLFANRVMPSSRPNYSEFLNSLGLSATDANPMLILARSGGKSQTDHIELFPLPVQEPGTGCYLTHCLVRAIRYMPQPWVEQRIARLQRDEKLFVMPDPQNVVDPACLAVRTDDYVTVGFLPAYLTADLWRLHNECPYFQLYVEKVNLPPVEIHHRLLCRVEAC